MVTATCPECDHVQERPTDTTAELRCMICGIMFALPILSQVKLQKTLPSNDDLPTIKPIKKTESTLGLAAGESEDNKPSKSLKKAKSFDEHQNEPRSKKKEPAKSSATRKRRDTGDDDAPRRGSRGLNASGMRLMIGMIVAGALFLGTVGTGAWFLFGKSKTPTVATAPPNFVPPMNVMPPMNAAPVPIDVPVVEKPVSVKVVPPVIPRKNVPFVNPLPDPPVPVKPEPVVEVVPFIRPPEKVMAITPTLAVDGAEVKLPGTADRVCYGGGGRFVIFRIPSVKQIAVLDLSLGKVAKYIPLAEDGAMIAAGMNKLYTYSPNAAVFQRWDLITFEKEATVPNPLGGAPKQILMGNATDGPLYIGGQGINNQKHFGFLDGRTFKSVELASTNMSGPAISDWYPPTVRISGDGRVFSWWSSGLSPSGFSSFVIGNTEAKSYSQHTSVGPILPGPDGTLFTGAGVYTPEQKKLDNSSGAYSYSFYPPIPPAQGRAYVHISNERPGTVEKTSNRISLKIIGDDRPLVSLNNVKGLELKADNNNASPGAGLPLYDRVYLVPNAKVLAVLAATGDKVYLNAFDLKAVLNKSGTDFLIVVSQPPSAVLDKTYRYKPEVLSKKGEVKLKLESGPDGMKIDGNEIVWDVPKSHPKIADVILTVSDKSGQETFHTFTIAVNEK